MKSKILWCVIPLVVTGAWAGKGKVRIASDANGAFVYVDGKKKAMIGEGFTSILLDEGEYTIKVAIGDKYEKYATQQIFVGEDSSVKVTLNPDKYQPSDAYAPILRELDTPKLARWQRSNEIVTDTQLGLMWQDDSEAKSTKKSWKNAKSYCKNLSLGGYSDWRLPSYEELLTIVDYDRYDPVIMPSFQNVTSSNYWSSSEDVSDAKYAWVVYFGYGDTYYGTKSNEYSVRCVRARQ